MRRALLAIGLLLAGCASPEAAPAPAPQPARAEAVPPLAAGAAVPDACGAGELQGLIGRPRTELPAPVDPDLWRVACTTCPITQDFNPRRLDVFFDAGTGVIREIRCG